MPNLPRRVIDPYRELGVQRAASDAEIKKAHRKLAKQFHPDAAAGDTVRFLAVQEAYLLLSDPLRRRDWDAKHAPGPVRASEPRRARPRGADGRWTREEGAQTGQHQRGAATRRPAQRTAPAAHADGGPQQAAWSGSDRPAGARSYRWTAENVPWWEDFTPRDRSASDRPGSREPNAEKSTHGAPSGRRPPAGARTDAGTTDGARGNAGAGPRAKASPGASRTTGETGTAAPGSTGSARPSGPTPDQAAPDGQRANDFDVYSRSSGAAWSSAARQYFRKAAEDLPSRGSFVYRGTQVVTGAKAREAAEDLLRQRPGVSAAPRQAFEARESAARSASPGSGASGAQAHRRGVPPAPPVRGAEPDVEPGPVSHSSREPGLIATAAVGGAGALVVTLPALVLATVALDPPLQPAFAALLLLLAAVAGALAASVWVRVRPRD